MENHNTSGQSQCYNNGNYTLFGCSNRFCPPRYQSFWFWSEVLHLFLFIAKYRRIFALCCPLRWWPYLFWSKMTAPVSQHRVLFLSMNAKNGQKLRFVYIKTSKKLSIALHILINDVSPNIFITLCPYLSFWQSWRDFVKILTFCGGGTRRSGPK